MTGPGQAQPDEGVWGETHVTQRFLRVFLKRRRRFPWESPTVRAVTPPPCCYAMRGSSRKQLWPHVTGERRATLGAAPASPRHVCLGNASLSPPRRWRIPAPQIEAEASLRTRGRGVHVGPACTRERAPDSAESLRPFYSEPACSAPPRPQEVPPGPGSCLLCGSGGTGCPGRPPLQQTEAWRPRVPTLIGSCPLNLRGFSPVSHASAKWFESNP